MALWHFPFELADCTVDVINMFGHGGNLVQLLPLGKIGFQLKDVGLTAHRQIAEAVNELQTLCTPNAGQQ